MPLTMTRARLRLLAALVAALAPWGPLWQREAFA